MQKCTFECNQSRTVNVQETRGCGKGALQEDNLRCGVLLNTNLDVKVVHVAKASLV